MDDTLTNLETAQLFFYIMFGIMTVLTVAPYANGIRIMVIKELKHRRREKAKKKKFMQHLRGTRFESWKELKAYYKNRIDFNLDGNFDALRHGDLYGTLRHLEQSAETVLKEWYS